MPAKINLDAMLVFQDLPQVEPLQRQPVIALTQEEAAHRGAISRPPRHNRLVPGGHGMIIRTICCMGDFYIGRPTMVVIADRCLGI